MIKISNQGYHQKLSTRDITTIGLQDLRARLTIIPQVNTVLNDDHGVMLLQRSCILFASIAPQDKTFCTGLYQRPIGHVNFSTFFRSRPYFLGAFVSILTLGTSSLTRLCIELFTVLDSLNWCLFPCVLLFLSVFFFFCVLTIACSDVSDQIRLRSCQEGWSTRCLKEEQA